MKNGTKKAAADSPGTTIQEALSNFSESLAQVLEHPDCPAAFTNAISEMMSEVEDMLDDAPRRVSDARGCFRLGLLSMAK